MVLHDTPRLWALARTATQALTALCAVSVITACAARPTGVFERD
jgi:hypothetical protein